MYVCKVTAAVCKQCGTVNFPGCREHRNLLTEPYAKDEVHTACRKKKCTTNSYASKFPCTLCKGTNYDVHRLAVTKQEINGVVSAFHKRAGGKGITGMRMDSCMIVCMECACLVFPVLNKRLCVLDQNGQLLDADDQPVDLTSWQARLPHCTRKCPGRGVGPFARMDVRLDFGELQFVADMLVKQKKGKWKHVFFEGKYAYEKQAFVTLSPASEPFKGGPIYGPEAPPDEFHPIAVGVCKCCCYVTFGHCMRHSTFLTRADIQLDIVVACPVEGCQVDSSKTPMKCRRGKSNVEWLPLMLGKHEAAYIRRAWYGRGLHYHSNQTFATKLLMCKHCKGMSLPGVEYRLCELSRQGNLSVDHRGTPDASIRNFKHSHTHLAGCPGLGNYKEVLKVRDVVLLGDEIDILHRFLPNSASGAWPEEVLQFRNEPSEPESSSSSSSSSSPPSSDPHPGYAQPIMGVDTLRGGAVPSPGPGGVVFIDPATGAPVVMAGAYPPATYAPGMPPQPQLYPTLSYGMAPPPPEGGDYNPFMGMPPSGGVPMGYHQAPGFHPGMAAAPSAPAAEQTAAFGLGSSASASASLGHQTIPRHNPAFPPQPPQGGGRPATAATWRGPAPRDM